MKCNACEGTGKAGLYTFHKCYRCSGSGKVNTKKGKKQRGHK